MKKYIYCLGVLLLLTATSCRKNWKCTCVTTTTTAGNGTHKKNTYTSIFDTKKEDAEAECQDTEARANKASADYYQNSTGIIQTTSCSIGKH